MRILITNDDGIHSPGLIALARGLCDIAEVIAIAPDRPRSATGHAITLHKPLRMHPVDLPGCAIAYSTNGTPSDCVLLGVVGAWDAGSAGMGNLGSGASSAPPLDLVISGINQGPNLGEDLTYSGTVSAAMEATICGLPAFAISVASLEAANFDTAACFARHVARTLSASRLPEGTFLNINVPDCDPGAIAGIAVTRQGRRRYQSRVDKRVDPRGWPYYWLGGDLYPEDSDHGTDVGALAAGMISVTPIHLDLTDHEFLEELKAWSIGEHWRCEGAS